MSAAKSTEKRDSSRRDAEVRRQRREIERQMQAEEERVKRKRDRSRSRTGKVKAKNDVLKLQAVLSRNAG
jgi:hypothetical protein